MYLQSGHVNEVGIIPVQYERCSLYYGVNERGRVRMQLLVLWR